MQQNSSPDCRFHTNQPRKFTKTFSQLLKRTKSFLYRPLLICSMTITGKNLSLDTNTKNDFKGCGEKKTLFAQPAPTTKPLTLAHECRIRSHLCTGQQPLYGRFSKSESMKVQPCFLPSPTQDTMVYISLHMETRVHAVSTNKALLYYDCHGVVG